MFGKTLVKNNDLFDLFCSESSHIDSYHAGDLYVKVHCFDEIFKECNGFAKQELKNMLSRRCDGLIYEHKCLIKQMEKYPKVLETLIEHSNEKINELEELKKEIVLI